MPTQAATSNLPVAVAAATTVVLWASGFPGIRVGLSAYGPGELALLRFLTASAVFAIYALVARPKLPSFADWPRIVALGATGIAGYNLALNFGERTVAAGTASFLVATVPLFTALLAAAVLRERLHRLLLSGLVVGLAGAGIITLSENVSSGTGLGALSVLVAAALQATFFVLQKGALTRYGPLALMAYATWTGTILLSPSIPGLVEQAWRAPAATTMAVVYLGIFPGAIAFGAWALVLSRWPASRAAPLLYLIPVVATLISWMWLGETPRSTTVVGGITVITGVALSRPRSREAASPNLRSVPQRNEVATDTDPDSTRDPLERASVRQPLQSDVRLKGVGSRPFGGAARELRSRGR